MELITSWLEDKMLISKFFEIPECCQRKKLSLDSCVRNIKGKDVMKEGYTEDQVWKIFMREVSYMLLL